MPKKQKTPKKSVEARNGDSAEGSPAAARSESSAPAKNRKIKTPSRKAAAPRATKVRKTPAKSAFAEPTAEQVQLRAYFISEHRHRHGTPGDHHSDWLEARRQLMIEAQRN